ncbi:hypothetical protein G786_02926 [Escherichia coli HVH 126 (4-6034225)]|nr:hypothetical protein G786_02926 [Escherichia coli HVH 126 (4-6034225)]
MKKAVFITPVVTRKEVDDIVHDYDGETTHSVAITRNTIDICDRFPALHSLGKPIGHDG